MMGTSMGTRAVETAVTTEAAAEDIALAATYTTWPGLMPATTLPLFAAFAMSRLFAWA